MTLERPADFCYRCAGVMHWPGGDCSDLPMSWEPLTSTAYLLGLAGFDDAARDAVWHVVRSAWDEGWRAGNR